MLTFNVGNIRVNIAPHQYSNESMTLHLTGIAERGSAFGVLVVDVGAFAHQQLERLVACFLVLNCNNHRNHISHTERLTSVMPRYYDKATAAS